MLPCCKHKALHGLAIQESAPPEGIAPGLKVSLLELRRFLSKERVRPSQASGDETKQPVTFGFLFQSSDFGRELVFITKRQYIVFAVFAFKYRERSNKDKGMYICMHACMHACMCACIHNYIHTHTYIHIYIYI